MSFCGSFCLTIAKNFVVEPFCFSEIFWYRKIVWIRGLGGEWGSITIFRQKNFVSQCRKSLEEILQGFIQF